MITKWDHVQDKLLGLIEHATANSSFYNQRLQGVTDAGWSQARFEQIPILEKSELTGREESLLTDAEARLYVEYTSGSTGQPLKCYKSVEEKWKKARLLWGLRKTNGGIGPKDPYAMFYAFNEDDLSTDPISIYHEVMYLSMLDLSPERLDDYYEALLKYRPQWPLSVSTALYLFANHLLERNLDRANFRLNISKLMGRCYLTISAR
ncbi:hypothetical protein P9222_18645 [Paenibacillus amylolyticus]|nr:hypothetical protein [Paenibacillus amylolyticus]WFR60602.1 hypothetical protein P9222_18645 [Paenibacillus amylolyticus]